MAKKDIQLDRPTWTTKKKEWGEMGKNEANENMMNKGFRNEKCKIEETGSILIAVSMLLFVHRIRNLKIFDRR